MMLEFSAFVTETLAVTQAEIFKRLKALLVIQKQGNREPSELKLRDFQRRRHKCYGTKE